MKFTTNFYSETDVGKDLWRCQTARIPARAIILSKAHRQNNVAEFDLRAYQAVMETDLGGGRYYVRGSSSVVDNGHFVHVLLAPTTHIG